MQAYGIRNKFIFNYKDNHPRKGYINWWQSELGTVINKKTARQNSNNILAELVYDHYFGLMHLENSNYWKDES